MGFFSWKTCDTAESVMNEHTTECQTVYFLQPNGKPSIKEDSYDGYGRFNGVDAYEWLLRENAEHLGINLLALDDNQVLMAGINLDCGVVCIDNETGEYWCLKRDVGSFRTLAGRTLEPGTVIRTFQNWGYVVDHLSASINQLVKEGRFKKVALSDLIKHPIKLSFNPEAKYEDYPASERCPYQGYFID